MRGGLDDALERLARRDRLRRRTEQPGGTPPEVTEVAEAVAAVVARHPELTITMGVEGAGPPVLLHVGNDDGVVRITAEDPLQSPRLRRDTAPVEVDFDLELDLDADRFSDPAPEDPGHATTPGYAEPPPAAGYAAAMGPGHPEGIGAPQAGAGDPVAFERPPPAPHVVPPQVVPPRTTQLDYVVPEPALQPPPAPMPGNRHGQPAQSPGSIPARSETLLPPARPVPLRVAPEDTEQAAKRLAALLREDPSLLHPAPPD